jgi:signal transduction histidine kinase
MGTISIQPIAMDLPAFIRDIISIFGPIIATKQITVHTEFAPDVAVYAADQKVMDIVMQNLISNAIKYTPDNGMVTVRLKRDATAVVISVSDTGIGIPREAQGRVFAKLFRADNAQIAEADGSGLGLYLVKSILEQVGGGISFTSEIGVGSTFIVRLPAAGMKARAGVRAVVSAPPSAGSDDMTVPTHTP